MNYKTYLSFDPYNWKVAKDLQRGDFSEFSLPSLASTLAACKVLLDCMIIMTT